MKTRTETGLDSIVTVTFQSAPPFRITTCWSSKRTRSRHVAFGENDPPDGTGAVHFPTDVYQPRHHSALVKLLSVLDLAGSENSVLEGQSTMCRIEVPFCFARTTLRVYEPTSALSRYSVPNGGRPTWNSALITVHIACSRSRPATSVCVRAA